MKLVELLVKHITEWPEGVTYFVQDGDGEVKAGGCSELSGPTFTGVWIRETTLDNYNFHSSLCADWQTSVVTKDIYTKHKEETQMKRKVREDFDPAKEYSVNVSGCTEEDKKEVQQAFFDAGFLWEFHGSEYLCLEAVQYTNTASTGEVMDILMFGSTSEECNMTAKEFLDLVYEPEKQGHVHAELMAQYAEDAKTHAEPWKLWQFKGINGDWLCCGGHPAWDYAIEYRRKPKTKLIHGVEVPDIGLDLSKCEGRTDFYVPCIRSHKYYVSLSHHAYNNCIRYSQTGIAYPHTEEGKQAAILHAKAMLGIAQISGEL